MADEAAVEVRWHYSDDGQMWIAAVDVADLFRKQGALWRANAETATAEACAVINTIADELEGVGDEIDAKMLIEMTIAQQMRDVDG